MTSHAQADSVRDIVAGVAHHIDAKRWSELRALYADEVQTDYTSLFGGAPQKRSGDALIAGWRGVLEIVRTHHLPARSRWSSTARERPRAAMSEHCITRQVLRSIRAREPLTT